MLVSAAVLFSAVKATTVVAGAVALIPEEYRPSYQQGYDSGYSTGYQFGYSTGTARGTEEGTSKGQSDGYTDGWQKTYQPAYNAAYDANHPIGQQEGWKQGVLNGIDEGFAWADKVIWYNSQNSGLYVSGSIDMYGGSVSISVQGGNYHWVYDPDAAGYYVWRNTEVDWTAHYFSTGYDDGKALGNSAGDAAGYVAAFPAAYAAAFEIGVDIGKVAGQKQGATDGKEKGYSDGWMVTYNSGYGRGFDAGVKYRVTGQLVMPPLEIAVGSSGKSASVPEPAAMSLFLMAVTFLSGGRRARTQ